MKTHKTSFGFLVLMAALAVSADAQEPQATVRFQHQSGPDDLARLEDRIADLEARVAAIEERGHPRLPGGDGIARVAFLADGAMRRLVEMARALRPDLGDEEL